MRGFRFNYFSGSFRRGMRRSVRTGVGPDGAVGRIGAVRRSVSRGLGLEGHQTGERANELAVEGDFISEKDLRGTGAFGGAAKGESRAHGGRTSARILKGHVAVEGVLLHIPHAEQPPAGGGHGLDQHDLRGGGWPVFRGEGGEEFGETIGRFLGEDHAAAEQAVAGAAAGGVLFSGWGDGAFGAGSVGLRGLDLTLGGHGGDDTRSVSLPRVAGGCVREGFVKLEVVDAGLDTV